ncbi:hypothetical protein RIF29_16585 [Crotalaria pallida]|uniref:Uncharacterized protein n=1 Tax=Crotalaria pallida TaxID=3830 RepID=A0AAN9IC67_CROPI
MAETTRLGGTVGDPSSLPVVLVEQMQQRSQIWKKQSPSVSRDRRRWRWRGDLSCGGGTTLTPSSKDGGGRRKEKEGGCGGVMKG